MLDKPLRGRRIAAQIRRGQQFVMTENLAEASVLAGQRKAQPGMDAAARLDKTAHRFAAINCTSKTQGIALAVRTGDFRDRPPPYFGAEDLAQPGAGDPETAFALLVHRDDGDAGQHAAQRAGIDALTRHRAMRVAAGPPISDQDLLRRCHAGKNRLLTHVSPPPW